jgi:hypothetical protein
MNMKFKEKKPRTTRKHERKYKIALIFFVLIRVVRGKIPFHASVVGVTGPSIAPKCGVRPAYLPTSSVTTDFGGRVTVIPKDDTAVPL